MASSASASQSVLVFAERDSFLELQSSCCGSSDPQTSETMPKAPKEKHRKRSTRSNEPAEYRLLTYAALGSHRKMSKLLKKHPQLDINFYDAHGSTALHQVSELLSTALCISARITHTLVFCRQAALGKNRL